MRLKTKFSALCIFLLICSGWTSKTHQMIAVKASNLTPYELKLLIKKYKTEILEGAIEPLKGKKDEGHYLLVDGSYGKAHLVINAQVQSILKAMKEKRLDLADFCRRLGVISHYVAEVNNPVLTGDLKRNGAWFYNSFVQYTDSKLDRFALTFDGYKNDLLENGDYEGFVIASAIRSAGNFDSLKNAYLAVRNKNGDYIFDEKSIPFAASSLAFNYAVTDTAKIWYYIWRDLKGDISFAPYDKNSSKAR